MEVDNTGSGASEGGYCPRLFSPLTGRAAFRYTMPLDRRGHALLSCVDQKDENCASQCTGQIQPGRRTCGLRRYYSSGLTFYSGVSLMVSDKLIATET